MDAKRLEGLALAGIIHDLNNVLETIEEAAELIGDDERWSEVAAAISRSVKRGRRIVGSMAGQARPGCDLAVVVDRAADFLHDVVRLLPVAAARVERRFEAGLRITGEASDWERVFMNLFLNAAQAMGEGGEIVVQAGICGSMAAIEVIDTGSGIPVEHLDSIFQPHFSTRTAGGGLGLHIVASLVEQHGGCVSAANRSDRAGACFQIRTPLARN